MKHACAGREACATAARFTILLYTTPKLPSRRRQRVTGGFLAPWAACRFGSSAAYRGSGSTKPGATNRTIATVI
jgi:hypothetical protein